MYGIGTLTEAEVMRLLLLPDRFHDLRIHHVRDRHIDGGRGDDLLEGGRAILWIASGDQLADRSVLQRIVLLEEQRHHAQVLRVVGKRAPVIWSSLLHHFPGGVLLDRLTPAEAKGVIWRVASAHGEGVRRIHRVQMLLAEVEIIQRIRSAAAPPGLADRVLRPGCRREHYKTCDQDCEAFHGDLPPY